MRTHIPFVEFEESLDRLTADLLAATTEARQDVFKIFELVLESHPQWPSMRSKIMKVFSPDRGLISKLKTCVDKERQASRKEVLLDSSDDAQLEFPFMN